MWRWGPPCFCSLWVGRPSSSSSSFLAACLFGCRHFDHRHRWGLFRTDQSIPMATPLQLQIPTSSRTLNKRPKPCGGVVLVGPTPSNQVVGFSSPLSPWWEGGREGCVMSKGGGDRSGRDHASVPHHHRHPLGWPANQDDKASSPSPTRLCVMVCHMKQSCNCCFSATCTQNSAGSNSIQREGGGDSVRACVFCRGVRWARHARFAYVIPSLGRSHITRVSVDADVAAAEPVARRSRPLECTSGPTDHLPLFA
ncbi:hypothetical protein BHM03_00028045 [Ensete ventricosum]|nr:hypothetical protein BHM03_00028045 [Ensete ventricosum]